jgi:hypothetical protein
MPSGEIGRYMEITIPLDVFERRFLLMLAEREKNIIMNHDVLSLEVIKALENLESKGAISKEKNILIGSNKYRYRLTDTGSNLVALIKENLNV